MKWKLSCISFSLPDPLWHWRQLYHTGHVMWKSYLPSLELSVRPQLPPCLWCVTFVGANSVRPPLASIFPNVRRNGTTSSKNCPKNIEDLRPIDRGTLTRWSKENSKGKIYNRPWMNTTLKPLRTLTKRRWLNVKIVEELSYQSHLRCISDLVGLERKGTDCGSL